MKRYQVSVLMVDPSETSPKKISVIVNGLPKSADNDGEENGNIISDMFRSQEYVKVAGFDILEPRDCFVNVEAIKLVEKPVKSQKGAELSPQKDGDEKDEIEKSVEILHHHDKKESEMRIESESTEGIPIENSSEELFQIHDGSEQRYSMSINMNELKNADGVVFYILADAVGKNEQIETKIEVNDMAEFAECPEEIENFVGNFVSDLSSDSSDSDVPPDDTNNNADAANVNLAQETTQTQGENVVETDNIIPGIADDSDGDALPPVRIQIVVQDNLQITLTMKNSKLSKVDRAERISDQDDSSHSVLASGVDSQYLISSKVGHVPQKLAPPEEATTAKNEGKREIFRKLICERLHSLGVSYNEALSITDNWNNGVRHRARCLPRVPKSTPKKKGDGEEEEAADSSGETGKAPRTYSSTTGMVTTIAGSRLPSPRTSALSCPEDVGLKGYKSLLQVMDTIIGILNSACCTAIESKYFLVLPHLNLGEVNRGESSEFYDFGYKPEFMKNWIDIIFMAAYQISPTDCGKAVGLVKNELKPLKHSFVALNKTCKIMSKKLDNLKFYLSSFRRRLLDKIQENTNWPQEFLKRKIQLPNYNSDSIQMMNFPPSDIFDDYLCVRVFKDYGLHLKYKNNRLWTALSGLQPLEKRVIFMGLIDHAKNTCDSISTTLGQVRELYTPGYPTSVMNRLQCLFSIVILEDKTLAALPIHNKLELHSRVDNLLTSLERFLCIYDGLATKLHDGKKRMRNMKFNPEKAIEYIKGKSLEIQLAQIIVPITTLSLQQLGVDEGSGQKLLIARRQFPEVVVNND